MGDRIGSLEAGKQADLIVLDTNRPPLAPLLLRPARNIVPNLVYAETGSNVMLSMVAGRVIYEQGEFTMIDRKAIMEDVKRRRTGLLTASLRIPRSTPFRLWSFPGQDVTDSLWTCFDPGFKKQDGRFARQPGPGDAQGVGCAEPGHVRSARCGARSGRRPGAHGVVHLWELDVFVMMFLSPSMPRDLLVDMTSGWKRPSIR